ncbi:uncharacterized protein LOC126893866 [Daktulosphaira vitifoliae]|uniref:uncharacterized protein LOC126893866 n=1 Tax=Daktulosphaira vitifoliae TaxID=58002 RepID=UPI0021A9CD73|nr:uncharacterized protein LOC126893866 [Daktulosphaira vitifoliae]
MFLNKLKLVFFFIQTINQSICVDLNNITREDIQTLEMEYKDMKFVKLMDHPYYIKSRNEDNFCPVPYSHLVDYHDISFEGINIINRSLQDVVYICVIEKKYKLAYTIFLNAIESMAITYMYRFCEFAIEMNKKHSEISFYLKVLSDTLAELIPIINREWISPDPYECILDVYNSHKSEEYKFNEVNTNYRNALLSCMELMKDKVHFLKEPKKVTMNELTVNQLKQYQDMSNRVISGHLTLKSGPTYKDITGDLYQTSCTSCKEENTGTTNEIYILSPCGHGWCCELCINKFRRGKLSKCPVCFQKIRSTQELDIQTSVSIVTEKYVPLQARCILDEREARCIKCRSQVTDDNDDDELSKSYIMIPCGHGWYCENCIKHEKCSKCKQKKTNKLCITLKNNELDSE